ncbi:F-box/FBD/LRR-repeat protein At5g56420-like isoform X2 [Argentina anserina]|uniref:F-box/FBD/LRR-repeat protein At5g56420-like isoform X2 n=1 Tax=Argentina anserina TaxID=57926 RepID=UPI0021763118|nr:F-box/FBD/LRR-repeat protein At5g56420-like isoform X2 [Potentilla anserina]
MGIGSRSKKKKKVVKKGGIDRISTLPDEIVLHILGLMPTLDSVRTSVLSKRWNNMWNLVPNLDLDDRRDFPDEHDDDDCNPFARFVCAVLYARNIDIAKFSLSVVRPPYFAIDLAVIDDWFCAVVRRKVVELDFEFCMGEEFVFTIPRCLLMCKTLRVLKLAVWDFDFPTDLPASGCFPSLKVLHVALSGNNLFQMENLFSCCSVLEDLIIDGNVDIGDADIGYNFNVSVPQVKTLNISFHVWLGRKGSRVFEYDSEQFETRINVYIDAPKLEKLDLGRDGFTNYVLMRAKSLVNASIDVKDSRREHPPHFPSCATALLVAVSNVRYLSLVAPWSKDWLLPAFDNLKQLKLVLVHGKYWELLPEFLCSAPNLEDLVLENPR